MPSLPHPPQVSIPVSAWLLAVIVPVAALVLGGSPALSLALQWDRGDGGGVPAPWQGQWLTSHLVHWSWGHLIWDLAAFAVLSVLCLRMAPRRYAAALLLASGMIPLEVRLFEPQFLTYRGLSGLDSALFGLVVVSLWQAGSGSPARLGPRLLALLGTCGLVGKAGFELITGTTLFAPSEPGLYLPVPSAHLAGFAAGVIAGLPVFSSMRAAPPPFRSRLLPRFRNPACPR